MSEETKDPQQKADATTDQPTTDDRPKQGSQRPKQRHRLMQNPESLGITERIKRGIHRQSMGLTAKIGRMVGAKATGRFTSGNNGAELQQTYTQLSVTLGVVFLSYEVLGQLLPTIQTHQATIAWLFFSVGFLANCVNNMAMMLGLICVAQIATASRLASMDDPQDDAPLTHQLCGIIDWGRMFLLGLLSATFVILANSLFSIAI